MSFEKADELLAAAQKAAPAPEPAKADRTKSRDRGAVYDEKLNPGAIGRSAPNVTTGPLGQDTRGYSFAKAIGYARGVVPAENAKEEIEISRRLKALYAGFVWNNVGDRAFLVPAATSLLPTGADEAAAVPDDRKVKYVAELRQKILAGCAGGYDPDEEDYYARKGLIAKSLGTTDDTAGGVLRGFPTLGEIIDLQRNMEVFLNAGATEVPLPPNGLLQFPKLTGGATAYFVGEANAATASQEATGSLDLRAKKLVLLVPINLELLRFATPTTEGVVRRDMAKQAALKADQEMLYGVGGNTILGLFNYQTATTWTQNTDKLLLYTATGADTNGDLFQPEDVFGMESLLPDGEEITAWVMRKQMFAKVATRRADAVAASDGKGMFVFNVTRAVGDNTPPQLEGTKVVRSSQLKNDETKGSGTGLTSVLTGNFQEWVVARVGVMEFDANPYADTVFTNYQQYIRGVQFIDAGARHAASFVRCKQLRIA